MSVIDRNAMLARIELVASTLMLGDDEIPGIDDDAGVIAFARRTGQSIDWIVEGDLRGVITKQFEARQP